MTGSSLTSVSFLSAPLLVGFSKQSGSETEQGKLVRVDLGANWLHQVGPVIVGEVASDAGACHKGSLNPCHLHNAMFCEVLDGVSYTF
jgi:hypothetical protein